MSFYSLLNFHPYVREDPKGDLGTLEEPADLGTDVVARVPQGALKHFVVNLLNTMLFILGFKNIPAYISFLEAKKLSYSAQWENRGPKIFKIYLN